MTGNQEMHKRQLVDEVARRSSPWELTRRQVRDALHGILDVITDQMAEGNAITIAGFGRLAGCRLVRRSDSGEGSIGPAEAGAVDGTA